MDLRLWCRRIWRRIRSPDSFLCFVAERVIGWCSCATAPIARAGDLELTLQASLARCKPMPMGFDQLYLFAGSDDGGESAAAIYTLLDTAKLNDLNPESYLRYVLERIADHPINKIDELLP
jgi:transposase